MSFSQSKYFRISNFVRNVGLKFFARVQIKELYHSFLYKSVRNSVLTKYFIVPENLTSSSGNNGFFVPAERPY